jgi:hypothetical protein
VAQRTVLMTQTTSEYYDVQLTLNRYGITPAGGGPPPGDFPTPPGGTPAVLDLVQSTTRQSTPGVDSDYGVLPVAGHVWVAPTVGNLLLLGVTAYDNGAAQNIPTPSGWTAVTAIVHPSGTGADTTWSGCLFYKLADGTEVMFNPATGYDNQTVVLAEFDGPGTLVTQLSGADGPPGTTGLSGQEGNRSPTFAALTTTAAEPVMMIGWWGQTGATGLVNTSGATSIDQSGATDIGHPSSGGVALGSAMIMRPVATSSGSERLTGLIYGNNNFQFWVTAAFQGTVSATDNPPSPGQDIGWVVPTEVTDGEDFTWAMPFPFSDGSLEVRLDGMDQSSAITSYDGVCGEFTVSFEVQPGELLEARAIGR